MKKILILIFLLLFPAMTYGQTTISGDKIIINPDGGIVVIGGPFTRATYKIDIQGKPNVFNGDSQLNVQSNATDNSSMGAITISNGETTASAARTIYITVGDANVSATGQPWVSANTAVLGTTINTPFKITTNGQQNNGISIGLDGIVTIDKSLRSAEIGGTGTSLTLRGNPLGGMRWSVDSNVGFSFLNGNVFVNELGNAVAGSLPLCYEPTTGAIRVGPVTGCP